MSNIIIVGRLASPHGIHGWLKLLSYTQPVTNILNYPHWFIQKTQDHWEPIDMAALQTTTDNNSHIRIKFAHCDSPEVARAYTNLLIGVTRDQLPPLSVDDYYWSDLEGLSVINHEGVLLGQVSHLFSTGANDILVVKGDRERLLPYIKDVILEVDLKNRRITVNWDADF